MIDKSKALELCVALIGRPYMFGAKWDVEMDAPAGPTDCSGASRWFFSRVHGIIVPDGAAEQIAVTEPDTSPTPLFSLGFFDKPGIGVDHVGILFDESLVFEARGEPFNRVIIRPRAVWEAWGEFTGWRKLKCLA